MLTIKLILYTIVLTLCATGCQKSKTNATTFRVVLDRPANPNHIPIYIGNALGYFRDEGIFLEIQKPTTDRPLALLDLHEADLVLASLPRVFRAIARKHAISIVGRLIEKPTKGFMILQSSGMKSIDDFNGRIMGYDGEYSILPSAEVILDEKNIQLGCRLNLQNEALNQLVSKKIDILYGALENLEPEHMRTLGHKVRFFPVTDLGMPSYEEVVIAAPTKIRNNEKLVAGFQRALQKSLDFCRNQPDLAFEMYENLMPTKSRNTILWEMISWKKTVPMLAKSQLFSLDSVNTLAAWQYEKALIGTPIDMPSHFILNLSH